MAWASTYIMILTLKFVGEKIVWHSTIRGLGFPETQKQGMYSFFCSFHHCLCSNNQKNSELLDFLNFLYFWDTLAVAFVICIFMLWHSKNYQRLHAALCSGDLNNHQSICSRIVLFVEAFYIFVWQICFYNQTVFK